MGRIQLPEKAKLFIGIISTSQELILRSRPVLEDLWGPVDLESEFIPFDQTLYYEKEMGSPLLKKFYCFRDLIRREEIVGIKIKTNELETTLKLHPEKEGRDINLDPGYLTLVNVTLATTKDYRHRIYLDRGIYLENTLYYDAKKKSYSGWDWTYPDFRRDDYLTFFNTVRETYKSQLQPGEEDE
ncbi:MAG: DUF4416 family protein [bacterium]|nr:DUF4416 family protein [bacterium]